MSDEKTLDLKTEGETPSENDHSENKAEPETEDLDSEIDKVLGAEPEDDIDKEVEDFGDGTVALPKAKWDKMKEDRDNYRKGLKSLKQKVKGKKSAPEKKEAEPKKEEKSEFVTRKELVKVEQDKAIKKACEDSEIEKNWVEIIKHYHAPGTTSEDAYFEAIKDAHILWKSKNASDDDEEEDKNATSKLSAENKKLDGATDTGKGKKARKHILPRRTSIQEWYGKPDEENKKAD